MALVRDHDFTVGLRSGADRFFFYILTMAVTAFAAASQVFMFSAVIGVYNIANPLLLMVITISMVTSVIWIAHQKLHICSYSVDFSSPSATSKCG